MILIAAGARDLLHARTWAAARGIGYRSVFLLGHPRHDMALRGLTGTGVVIAQLGPLAARHRRAVTALAGGGAQLVGPDWWPGGGPEPDGPRLRIRSKLPPAPGVA